MRKINPWTKFFTADLVPDYGEIGNAFWGHHVANNVGRLLNLDGTVFFRDIGTSASKPSELYDISVARIPIEMCEFRTAPVVQLAAQVETPPSSGTIKFYGTWDGGVLARNVSDTDNVIQVAYNEWTFDEGEPYSNSFMRLGTSGEVMQILSYNVIPTYGSYVANYEVQRSAIGGITPLAYSAGVLLSYRTNQDGIETVPPVSGESQYILNPIFVEAVIDPTQLKIFWGNDSAGTVYFKIFGI